MHDMQQNESEQTRQQTASPSCPFQDHKELSPAMRRTSLRLVSSVSATGEALLQVMEQKG